MNVMTAHLTPAETALWIALNKVHRLCHAEINGALKSAGFPSIKWYDVLWGIELGGGSLRPFELEEQMIFEQSNLSHLIHRIAARGLIEIVKCDQDKRGKVLQITDEGRRVRARMWDIWGPLAHKRMADLADVPGIETVVQAMRKLS